MLTPFRAQFPILERRVHDQPLIYFDNAATTQKPQSVIDAISNFYKKNNANIHRSVHTLAAEATYAYEQARKRIAAFIGAPENNCIFVRGTTEAINLVAYGLEHLFEEGDIILVGQAEHHANIVPWVILAERTGAIVQTIPILENGEYDVEAYAKLLCVKVKLVALSHVSNVLGTIHPIQKMIEMAHRFDALTMIDGAQALPHFMVNVQKLGADFYAFSGHKMYGPLGVGVLYAKAQSIDLLDIFMGGGDMIESVAFDKITYQKPPKRFEAGTPSIADVVGLHAACDFIEHVSYDRIEQYEKALLVYATENLRALPWVHIQGKSPDKVGVISFTVDGIHPHDVGTLLDKHGIALRTGQHCAQPLLTALGLTATNRISFGIYNTLTEIDTFVEALIQVRAKFHG